MITAYALMFGGFLLLGGRMADLLGRRRLFIAGVALFTLSSLLAGFAWSEASLIAFRATQGLRVKRPTPAMKIRRRPSRSAIRPPSSRKPPNMIA